MRPAEGGQRYRQLGRVRRCQVRRRERTLRSCREGLQIGDRISGRRISLRSQLAESRVPPHLRLRYCTSSGYRVRRNSDPEQKGLISLLAQ
jgi:hypothetical protein